MKAIPCAGLFFVLWNCAATAQIVVPNPQATDSGFFGGSIASTADKVIVGAVNNVVSGEPAGAAYVLDSTTGSVLRTIGNPQPAAGDQFGSSMAALGGNVLIGAPAHQPPNNAAGSAYLFDISTGALQRTFLDPKPLVGTGNYFGQSVALVGSTALVGSPRTDNNSAVYQFDIASGNLVRTYTQPGPTFDTEFGRAIAASSGRILVDSRGGDPTAAVYLFDTTTGGLLRTITNPHAASDDFFGNSLALTDRWLVVGANQSTTGSGVVYLFDVNTGGLLRTLNCPTPQINAQFGFSVFALGDYLLVGANNQDIGSFVDAGAAYLFNGVTGDLLATYQSSTPSVSDLFGNAVALGGGRAIIGAPSVNNAAPNAGAVFLFPVAVPEPTSFMLVGLAILGFVGRGCTRRVVGKAHKRI